jgi:hypothetical protein
LVEYATKENGEKYERYLDDSERLLDITARWAQQ